MVRDRLWAVLILGLISACTLNINPQATVVPLPTAAPSPVIDNLPAVGFPDIEPSGIAACVLRNAGSVPVKVYGEAGSQSTAVAALQPGTGAAGFEYRDGWYHINFRIGDQESSGWVSESETAASGDCLDIQPPSGCSVQPSVGRVIDLYAQPDRYSQHVGALNERYFVPFLQFNADGWFKVDMGNGQIGWIAPDEGRLVGACDSGQ